MSQVPAGTGSGTAPVGPAVPAPPAGGEPSADTMTVSRDSVKDWGGDWHAMAKDAQLGRTVGAYGTVAEQLQAAGITPEQVATLVQPGYPPEGYVPPSQSAPAAGLGADEVRALFREEFGTAMKGVGAQFGDTIKQQREQDQKDMKRQADFAQANREEQEFMVKHLREMGVNPRDDKEQFTSHGQMFMRQFQADLNAVLAETQPEGADEEALNRHFAIASEEAMGKAAERMAWVRGFKYEAAVAAAQEQEGQGPAASLGAGEGGKQPPGDFDSMNREQQDAVIMEGIKVSEGEPAG